MVKCVNAYNNTEEIEMEYRKVKFYALNAQNQDGSFRTEKEIKKFIHDIYDSGDFTDDGYVYKVFELLKIKYTIEFTHFDGNEVFLRIRQPRPKNHYGKAEIENATLKDLEIDNTEHMESFTFFYIDLSTCIISHLKIQGTPSIGIFSRFLNNENEFGNGIKYSCDAIATEEIIKQIVNKQKFGTIVYSFVNPKDSALKDIPGLTDTIKEGLSAKRSTVEIRIAPERSKNLLKDGNVLYDFMKQLRKLYDKNLKKVAISAGDDGDSKMMMFNLLNQEFTQETSIRTDDELTVEEYEKAIKRAYEDIKVMLTQYKR